ncbi:MAG: rod shape-determining protein MreD [Clostridia bacterium]|jgi:rod shape-determining protein MreD
MIRRLAFSFLFVSSLLIIQTTWLDAIAIFSVLPDLALLSILYISFKAQGLQGQFTGFFSGLLQDGVSAAPLGLSAIINTLIATLFNSLSGRFYIDKVLMPMFFGLSATILKAIMLMILSWIFKGKILTYDFTQPLIWIEVAYNSIIAPVLFFFMKFFDKLILPVESRHD